MNYLLLSKLYYQNQEEYEKVYHARFQSEYAVRLNFTVGEHQAFFVQTPEIYKMMADILRMNKAISNLCQTLPGAAINQFFRRCLVDEIVLTNSIEGVRSTRKEISEILDELETKSKGKRFYGLVKKYQMLLTKEQLPLQTCRDIRDIYDELVLAEVKEEDPNNVPDGQYFRKDTVSVYSPSQKEIHKGLYPETKIIQAMEQAIQFLRDDTCDILCRISIFHYLLEYIHPFYDGNGRLGRFICSYLLAQELEPVTGYRLSYTIKENIKDYYKAFSVCNDPLNRGELTPFLVTFLEIIQESVLKLKDALQQGLVRWNRCTHIVLNEMGINDPKLLQVYDLLIQATLFSEHGVSMETIRKHIEVGSLATAKSRLEKIPGELLVVKKEKRTAYYSLNIDRLEQIESNLQ
ncbi:MAG: Fic family protein [Oscillospiraceae bacterium]